MQNTTKKCAKCKVIKPVNEFYGDKRRIGGKQVYCKKCHAELSKKGIINKWGTLKNYYSEYRNRLVGGNPSIIYSHKKHNAKSNNIEFDISRSEFIDWYLNQKKECYYCGISQDKITLNNDLMPNINIHRLTLDRLDSNKGYRLDNIVLCCARCNLIKNDFFTPEEMKEIGEKYVKKKWKT